LSNGSALHTVPPYKLSANHRLRIEFGWARHSIISQQAPIGSHRYNAVWRQPRHDVPIESRRATMIHCRRHDGMTWKPPDHLTLRDLRHAERPLALTSRPSLKSQRQFRARLQLSEARACSV